MSTPHLRPSLSRVEIARRSKSHVAAASRANASLLFMSKPCLADTIRLSEDGCAREVAPSKDFEAREITWADGAPHHLASWKGATRGPLMLGVIERIVGGPRDETLPPARIRELNTASTPMSVGANIPSPRTALSTVATVVWRTATWLSFASPSSPSSPPSLND